MAKYKVGDKVEIIDNRNGSLNSVGDVGEIVDINVRHDGKWYQVKVEGKPSYSNWSQVDEIRLVEPRPTKNQRITALENEVAELKVIVEGLRKSKFHVEADAEIVGQAVAETLENVIEFEGAKYRKVEREAREGDVVKFKDSVRGFSGFFDSNFDESFHRVYAGKTLRNGVNVYKHHYNRTPETVDVYELIVENKPQTEGERLIKQCEQHFPPQKSANQLRAEIIEKAKLFLSEEAGTVFEFIVQGNRILVLNNEDKLFAESKCHPNDVFNEHIGKAIALGRALGLDVSEFEQAVQPTFTVGQDFEFITRDDKTVSSQVVKVDGEKVWFMNEEGRLVWVSEGWSCDGKYSPKITNDTNAIYSEVK